MEEFTVSQPSQTGSAINAAEGQSSDPPWKCRAVRMHACLRGFINFLSDRSKSNSVAGSAQFDDSEFYLLRISNCDSLVVNPNIGPSRA